MPTSRFQPAVPLPSERPPSVTVIDCDDCIGPSIGACEDCVVTFLCEREPDDAVVIDVAEARALRMLADADLVPACATNGSIGVRRECTRFLGSGGTVPPAAAV